MLSQNEIKENLYNSLKELGLTDNETNLYTVSLNLGPTSIANLATHLSVNRPNIYKIIKRLEEFGLAQFSERTKYQRNFMVKSPTIIRSLLNEKGKQLDVYNNKLADLMPDLLTLYHQGEVPTSIKIYSTEKEYVELLDSILEESKEEICYFGSAHDFIGFISWQKEQEWIVRRIKKGLRIKSLLLPSEDAQKVSLKDEQELRETRVLKNMGMFSTSFHLYANKVVLWQPKTTLAVLIEDEYFVQMLRCIFDSLWNASV